MKRKNATRHALFTSILSLLLCVSMLVSTTFAWFTDEVETGMNTIAAGNLDVELLADGNKVDSNTKLFDDVTLWEPGVVVYENLQVANVGTLALKYQMTLNFGNENDLNGHKLSEVLKVAVIDKIADGATRADVLEAAKASDNVGTLQNFYATGELEADAEGTAQTVVIFWEPSSAEVDNLYNANNGQSTSDGEPLHIEFGVNLQATQLMSENDSFGNEYDKFASILPKATVNNLGAQTVTATTSFPNGTDAKEYDLDVAFQFLPNETYEEAQSNGYRYWHADYVVKADKDVPANSMALAGYYAAFCKDYNNNNWVLLSSDDVIPAGTEIRLVELLGGGSISVNYEEICRYGNDGVGFLCGAVDLTGANAGTTITVELRLYETTKAPDATGGTANEEVDPEHYEVVGTYTYTFGADSAEDLQAALAAGNDEIVLAADIMLDDAPLTITDDTVIDLNGHTLTGVSTSSTTSNLIKVNQGAKLTLTGNGTINFAATTPDTNWGGEGQPAFPGYANNTISCSGKLVVDGVTIKNSTAPGGASYAIDCYPGADLVINSGTIDGMGKVAIRMFVNSNTVATNVTVNGGTITGRRGIWIQLPGSNIANERLANLTVNGGEIIATDESDCAIYSYSYGDSFVNTNITITGGEFTGVVAFGGGSQATVEYVTITGGTFNDGVGRYLDNDGWEEITVPTV